MLKKHLLFAGTFVALFAFVLATPALAQTEGETEEATAEEEVLAEDIVETDDGEVVVVDDTYEDEEVEEITEAPSGFGLFWRGVRERVSTALTFDPVKKAEKQLRYAEERRQIFEVMMQNAETEEQREKAAAHLERSQAFMEKVEDRREKWADSTDEERLRRLRANMVKSHVRRENLFDRLEERLPEERVEKLEALRLRAQDRADKLLERVENKDGLSPAEKAKLKRVRKHVAEKKEDLKELQERRDAIKEQWKDATPEERQEKLQELREERKEKIEEKKEKTQALLERRRDLTNDLKMRAEAGDAEAAKRLEKVIKVNDNIRDRVEERRENVAEKKEVLENIKDRKENLRERAADGSEQAADKLKQLNKVQKKVLQTPPGQDLPKKPAVMKKKMQDAAGPKPVPPKPDQQ